MSKQINHSSEAPQEVLFTPRLRQRELNGFLKFAGRLRTELVRNSKLSKSDIVDLFRNETLEDLNDGAKVEVSFAKSILLDLAAQDWQIKFRDAKLILKAPSISVGTSEQIKERIRSGHLVERNSKIKEPNTAGFIKSMESRRLTSKGWHSIFSLMRDGQDLADQLKSISTINDVEEKQIRLNKSITPYLQFIEPESICEHTGLKLYDVWRYFRLTWVNVHKSVPGRSMLILIRDAAAPNHPVIGIAALGSSVVQQSIRDKWIGWDSEDFVAQYVERPTKRVTDWFKSILDEGIKDIYLKDLLGSKIVTKAALKTPDDKTISALKKEARKRINQHRLYPTGHKEKEPVTDADCVARAESHLFRSKRCDTMASLLSIKRVLIENEFYSKRSKPNYHKGDVKRALKYLVRLAKGQHVGINMMDITVCGALAPYNEILGGKLVCMLLASPETVEAYAKRYSKHVSVIASSMKGKRVQRKPKLVLLCTTSLYGVGSSQYNRIKIPAEKVGGLMGEVIQYKELGLSLGYGSFHLSSDTLSLANTLLAQQKRSYRKVNSIFGEGVNPLMRKFRDAVHIIGLPGVQILNHGNKRVVYGIPLCTNLKEIMLGVESRPKYILPSGDGKLISRYLVEFWQERWLINRINNEEVLERVKQNRLSHPIQHRAKVPRLPEVENQIEMNLYSFS